MKRLACFFTFLFLLGCDSNESEEYEVFHSADVEISNDILDLYKDDVVIAVEGEENIKAEDLKFAEMMMSDDNTEDDSYWAMIRDHGGLTAFSKYEVENPTTIASIYESYGLGVVDVDTEYDGPTGYDESTGRDRQTRLWGERPDINGAQFCGKYFGSYYRNKTFNLNRYNWYRYTHLTRIDSIGRPWFSRAELDITKPYIGDPAFCNVKPWGQSGDQSGHIIANSLGGSGWRINLVPQARRINLSTFAIVEGQLRKCRTNLATANVFEVISHYNSGGARPSGFTLRVSSSTLDRFRPWRAIPTWRTVYVNNTTAGAYAANLKIRSFANWINDQCRKY